MMAARILSEGNEIDAMSSNKMEKYASRLIGTLQSQEDAERLLLEAAQVVEAAAAGDFNRDNIRTEPFTDKVKSAAIQRRASSVS